MTEATTTMYQEFLAAFGRREHEGYLTYDRSQKLALALVQALADHAGVPDDQVEWVPLDDAKGQLRDGRQVGHPYDAMDYGDDNWFHAQFRIVFNSPNTSLLRGYLIRLRIREEDGGAWAVKIYDDADPIVIRDNETGHIEFANHLMEALIQSMSSKARGKEQPVIGFHAI